MIFIMLLFNFFFCADACATCERFAVFSVQISVEVLRIYTLYLKKKICWAMINQL